MAKAQTILDKTLKNSEGRLTLYQAPNPPIIVWFIAWLTAYIMPDGSLSKSAVGGIAVMSLSAWCWLEMFSGVNYFRRALGLVVACIIICGFVK